MHNFWPLTSFSTDAGSGEGNPTRTQTASRPWCCSQLAPCLVSLFLLLCHNSCATCRKPLSPYQQRFLIWAAAFSFLVFFTYEHFDPSHQTIYSKLYCKPSNLGSNGSLENIRRWGVNGEIFTVERYPGSTAVSFLCQRLDVARVVISILSWNKTHIRTPGGSLQSTSLSFPSTGSHPF